MKYIFRLFFILIFSLQITIAYCEANSLFSMFPVPLKSSTLTARASSAYSSIKTFELRNLIGKKLQEKTLSAGETDVVFQDMDTYPNGLYVVAAKDANGKILETSKFIINKQ